MSEGLESHCVQCEAGMYPNEDKTNCFQCPSGTIKPAASGKCEPCPMYTYSDETRTSCIPFDIITDKLHNKLHLYLNQPDIFCDEEDNQHLCDSNNRAVGPIKLDRESKDKSQPVFYFLNQEPLETERYEFHVSRASKVSTESYIYMLFEQENMDIDMLDDYLEQSEDSKQESASTLSDEDIKLNDLFSNINSIF